MVTIKRLYEKWWDDNYHQTIEQLRDNWSNYDTPLAGSIYSWY
jgi:hypothetical protein